MKYVPYKQLSEEEINSVSPEKARQSDLNMIDLGIIMGGPLYSALWSLVCIALVLAREHLEKQLNEDSLQNIFENRNVTKYVEKAMLALGLELDEIKNLTPEKTQKITQIFFEKVIIAVNEEIDFIQDCKYSRQ